MKLNPSNINKFWLSPVSKLTSGKKTIESLAEIGIKTIYQLIHIFPLHVKEIQDFQANSIQEDTIVRVSGYISQLRIQPIYKKKKFPLYNIKAIFSTEKQDLNLTWFYAYPNTKKELSQLKEENKNFTLQGSLSSFHSQWQIINPQINPSDEDLLRNYPKTNKLSGKIIKKLIDKIPQEQWNDFPHSHFPQTQQENTLSECYQICHGLIAKNHHVREQARQSIVLYELIKEQLKLKKIKNERNQICIDPIIDENVNLSRIVTHMPYELTDDQLSSLNDIFNDFKKSTPMSRLLQGDVGCGKTTVAMIAALLCTQAQGQAAILCPTEALAQQHLQSFREIFNHLHEEQVIHLLTSTTPKRDKKNIMEKLKQKSPCIIIGTHSLFQESIQFQNLRFIVIDEQHKFGVEQRKKMIAKSQNPHLLIMSATPIPRTLQLAYFSDLEVSTIKTMPKMKKSIKSRIVSEKNYAKYLSFLKTRLEIGEQAYIVCPSIKERSINTQTIHNEYRKLFPDVNISILHSQLSSAEKERIMHSFMQNDIQLLIATSVIEVGINNPNATVMSIYSPEYFGLSSLHQLRGRVGRGNKSGFFFMMTGEQTPDRTRERLEIIEKCHNGFEIAEQDLKNRGFGQLSGDEQSGKVRNIPLFQNPDDYPLMEKAYQLVQASDSFI